MTSDPTRTVSRPDFDAAFAAFVGGLGDGRSLTGVGDDDNLFDAGVLDSFSVVRLIRLIEDLLGRPIDLETATIDSFATTDSIYRTFVGGRD